MPTGPERDHLADGSRLEQVVDEVFAGLAADAITGDGLAVWVGPGTEPGGRAGSVGPTLYGGTAGLALALAAYATHRSQDWALDLARLAARHAADQAATVPAAYRFGFYGGWAGIVYAVAAVAAQAGDPALRASARTLVQELADTAPSGEFDLVFGQAGTAAGMALVAPQLGEQALALAARSAMRLDASATRTRHRGSAWRSPRERGQLPLTGFAHGAAGVAWALLELAAVSPDRGGLDDLAEESFSYEAALFDPGSRNWPDLRHYSTWAATRALPPPKQIAWCHGAGGIALSRLRAVELTDRPTHLAAAVAAARTVAADAHSADRRGSGGTADGWGLCHGLGGHRLVLAAAERALDLPEIFAARQRLDVSLARIATAGTAIRAELPDPGLMNGRAGLGICLLSATGCPVGRILLPEPLSPRAPTFPPGPDEMAMTLEALLHLGEWRRRRVQSGSASCPEGYNKCARRSIPNVEGHVSGLWWGTATAVIARCNSALWTTCCM